MVEIKEEIVRSVALIIGPHSAAAKAIENAEARRAAGQTVRFYRAPTGSLIVEGTAQQSDKVEPNVG